MGGSGGQPLASDARAFMEARIAHDFGQVRVHPASRTAEPARLLSARALTVGRDVAFGAGQYTVATDAGKLLPAHELTHVVQQHPPRGLRFSDHGRRSGR